MSISNYTSPLPRHVSRFQYLAPLRASSPLSISLPVPPRERIKGLHTDALWNSAILMSDRIAIEEVQVKGRKILELGAGVGLPGIVSVKRGAEKVVLSDYNEPTMIQDLERSVEQGVPEPELRSKIRVVGHTWGESVQPLIDASPSGYDLILLSDVLYHTPSHPLLVRSLLSILDHSPNATIQLTAGFHASRDVVRQFFHIARLEAGIVPIEQVVEVSVTGDKRTFELVRQARGEKESQEERVKWCCVAVLDLQPE